MALALRRGFVSFLVFASFFRSPCMLVRATEPSSTMIGNITFNLPNGLEIEKVADDSSIRWPIAATYHASGDLLILECHWNRESVKDQLQSRPHKVVRLSDTDGDRHFDKRTVIADSLAFPEGIMVLDNDLLVAAPPQILRLSDKDQDGFFESQETWFDGTSLTYCANDLHGPMMGPDGWVYWTKGAFAQQNHELIRRDENKNDALGTSTAAHIYRRHPNGGPIDRLMTGGMDNPSDLTFTPEGEILFCATFLHHPGNGLRDGIAHAPRGGLFGKSNPALEGHWTTGSLLNPIANLGPAAPASVDFLKSNEIADATNWYETTQSSKSKDRFLVSAQFNLQKIGLHRLVTSGSSFETESHDLLTADRIDFHPVDILQESTGSLLVFDTGGWYDLCCPSSGSDQSIAHGGIYRLKIKGDDKGKRVATDTEPKARENLVNSLWETARELTENPNQPEKIQHVLKMLSDSDAAVQQTSAHIVGLNRWTDSSKALEQVLKSDSPAAIRAAIESLGIVGNGDSVIPIVGALHRFPEDRYLLHSAIYALLEIGDVNELVRVLQESSNDDERYAAMYALDQLKKLPIDLPPTLVTLLTSKSERLRELSLKCLSTYPEGISLCIPFLRTAWEQDDTNYLAAALPVLQMGASNDELRMQFTEWLQSAAKQSTARQCWLLDSIRQMGDQHMPTEWTDPLVSWIQTGTDESLPRICDAIQAAKFQDHDKVTVANALRSRAVKEDTQSELKLRLLSASPTVDLLLSERNAKLIIEKLTESESPYASIAETALARVNLLPTTAKMLIENLANVPPLYLQTTIDAVLRCNDPELDGLLLKQLSPLPGLKSLAIDRVMNGLRERPDSVKDQWKSIMESASRPPEDIAKNLEDWLARLPSGDAARGYQVFRSSKAACSGCHQVGYIGGRLGPELSHIGKSRTRRDLVEAVVFPSFRMAQGFYPTRVMTTDGQIFNGLLSKQTAEYVEMLCGVDKVCRIPKEDIEEQLESNISVMPSGLEQQISLEDFADLLAFLESKQ